jgi:Sap, sulfolipid-1-addressing protein
MLAASNPSLATQLASAIPLALAACVYPPAVAVLIYYLSRESPRRLLLAYFVGAFVMTFVVGVVGILFLGGVDVNPKQHRGPSAALDILLGAAMLLAAFVAGRRRPSKKDSEPKPPKQHRGGAGGAVLLGLVMYTPSLFYLSAMKLVADADPSVVGAVFSALVLTICVTLFIAVPIGLYLVFPDVTDRRLKVFNAWLHRHIRTLLVWGFTIGGSYLLGSGIYRLVSA